MNGKKFIASALFVAILLLVVIVPMSTQQSGRYDPWLDYNEDGKIDVNELQPLGQAYGTSGDPTKNVNVTNWPIERQLFPENLILEASRYYLIGPTMTPLERDLVDATTAPTSPDPQATQTFDQMTHAVTTEDTLLYTYLYVYQKIPTSAYRILGTPIFVLAFNATNAPAASLTITFHVYLGTVSMSNVWAELDYLGYYQALYSGTNVDVKKGGNVGPTYPDGPIDITVNANERLAIKIDLYGHTSSGTTTLTTEILLQGETFVTIPIVENS